MPPFAREGRRDPRSVRNAAPGLLAVESSCRDNESWRGFAFELARPMIHITDGVTTAISRLYCDDLAQRAQIGPVPKRQWDVGQIERRLRSVLAPNEGIVFQVDEDCSMPAPAAFITLSGWSGSFPQTNASAGYSAGSNPAARITSSKRRSLAGGSGTGTRCSISRTRSK